PGAAPRSVRRGSRYRSYLSAIRRSSRLLQSGLLRVVALAQPLNVAAHERQVRCRPQGSLVVDFHGHLPAAPYLALGFFREHAVPEFLPARVAVDGLRDVFAPLAASCALVQ